MGQFVTIGGDRLGSGKKMKQELYNYGRSTHNLSKDVKLSMGVGTLIPFYVREALPGDKFDIDIKTLTRTLPTVGPLFGSFKQQIDFFVCPIRLYQGILHNNPMYVGLNMKDIKLPLYRAESSTSMGDDNKPLYEFGENSLARYLGVSGMGRPISVTTQSEIERHFNAVPFLAYYDIYKNYYANKQEKIGYATTLQTQTKGATSGTLQKVGQTAVIRGASTGTTYRLRFTVSTTGATVNVGDQYLLRLNNDIPFSSIELAITFEGEEETGTLIKLTDLIDGDLNVIKDTNENDGYTEYLIEFETNAILKDIYTNSYVAANEEIILNDFSLDVIDEMRMEILKKTELGVPFVINSFTKFPYTSIWNYTTANNKKTPWQHFDNIGFAIKTYQSDIYNNWLDSEDINNNINEITTINTENGLSIDALNLAQKVYNMLNRVAVSGGTYEDWLQAVYSYEGIRKCETPMYIGGYTSEIMFEEVIATTANETDGKKQALGTLGGRGKQLNEKYGHINVTIDEPSFIIGIISLTPRIAYSQGNKFWATEWESLDDMHKPALDGIGFQDLIAERMAWWGTRINIDNSTTKDVVGKQPAWLEYTTDVDEVYGDLAKQDGFGFMVLNRNYAKTFQGANLQAPTDITTYIDPSKFNYAFTYAKIDSQNFWTQVSLDIKARRIMSARQIPNI